MTQSRTQDHGCGQRDKQQNENPAAGIQRTLINPTAPMPSFKSLQQNEPEKFKNLVAFLGRLKSNGN